MIFDGFPLSDGLASVEVDADRVEKGENCDDGKGACGDEGDASWLGAEVEESSCNGADIDGELEL